MALPNPTVRNSIDVETTKAEYDDGLVDGLAHQIWLDCWNSDSMADYGHVAEPDLERPLSFRSALLKQRCEKHRETMRRIEDRADELEPEIRERYRSIPDDSYDRVYALIEAATEVLSSEDWAAIDRGDWEASPFVRWYLSNDFENMLRVTAPTEKTDYVRTPDPKSHNDI